MTRIFFLLTLGFMQTIYAQKAVEKEIVAEGNRLYRSEAASWYGSDILSDKLSSRISDVGGYMSYPNGELTYCIFFSKGDQPQVLGSVALDSTYDTNTAVTDLNVRDFDNIERDLYAIRSSALAEIRSDTIFKNYKNASLNVVPLIDELGKRVYVLTGPKNNGVMLFGNDYMITFDKDGGVKAKTKLHKGLIPIEFGNNDGKLVLTSMHTHLPSYSEYVTATDICTLRLYQKFAGWKQHIVISKGFVSIWQCDSNELVVMTREAWNKISETKK